MKSRCSGRWSIAVDAVQSSQAILHLLLEVVAGSAEADIAAGDECVLLLLQGPCRGRLHSFAHDPCLRAVDLAIEIGKLGIGADRLLDRTARRRAVEARPAGHSQLGAETLELNGERMIVAAGAGMIRIEPQRGGEVSQGFRAVALLAKIGRAS